MLPRVGHRRIQQHPGGSIGDDAIDPVLLHRPGHAEQLLQLGRGGDQRTLGDLPHQGGKFVVLAEHHRQVLRGGRGLGAQQARRRALQHDGPIAVRIRRRRRQDRTPAHRVALQPDVGLVHYRQALEILERRRPPEPRRADDAAGITVPGHVHGQHHISAPRQLDGERALHLAGVDIAVADQHPRRGRRRRGGRRRVEQAGDGDPLLRRDPHLGDRGPADCLDRVRQVRAAQDQGPSQAKSQPLPHHVAPACFLLRGRWAETRRSSSVSLRPRRSGERLAQRRSAALADVPEPGHHHPRGRNPVAHNVSVATKLDRKLPNAGPERSAAIRKFGKRRDRIGQGVRREIGGAGTFGRQPGRQSNKVAIGRISDAYRGHGVVFTWA